MLAWKLPVTTLHCFACFPCSNLTDKSLPAPHKNGHVFQELKENTFLIFLHYFIKSSDFIHGQGHYAKVCNYRHFSATSKYKWGTLLCYTCWSLLLLAMPGFPWIFSSPGVLEEKLQETLSGCPYSGKIPHGFKKSFCKIVYLDSEKW